MNRTHIKLASIWVFLQAAFLAGWAASEEFRLSDGEGESILVRTAPVDPRDMLRGQYIRLGYEFNRMSQLTEQIRPEPGTTVWVVMQRADEFHEPVRAQLQRPPNLAPDQVAMRGRVGRWRIDFGVERYFVPEGTETPNQRDITVRLRVGDDGAPRIDTVYVRGIPWP